MTEDEEAQLLVVTTRLNEAAKQYARALEALQPALAALREAILQWGQQFAEALRPMLKALFEWWIIYRREALYQRLLCWHMPHFLARFLADRWPRCWLPEP